MRARCGEAGDADVAVAEGDGAGVCASSMGEMAGLMAAIEDVDMDEGAEIESVVEGVVEGMVARVVAMAGWRKKNSRGTGGLRKWVSRRDGAKAGIMVTSLMDSMP